MSEDTDQNSPDLHDEVQKDSGDSGQKREKNEIAMEAIEQFSKLYKENLEKRRRKN